MLSNKSNTLNYMIMDGIKNPKNKFLLHFDLITKHSDLDEIQYKYDSFSP